MDVWLLFLFMDDSNYFIDWINVSCIFFYDIEKNDWLDELFEFFGVKCVYLLEVK